MRATITITLEDDISEEKLNAAGISRGALLKLYEGGFIYFLEAIDDGSGRIKKDLHIVIEDNTKEAEQ